MPEPIKGLSFEDKLIVAQMSIDGLSQATISFFALVRNRLKTNHGVSIADMSRDAYIRPKAARRHIDVLKTRGYIKRIGLRSWVIGENVIRDRDLLIVKRIYSDVQRQQH